MVIGKAAIEKLGEAMKTVGHVFPKFDQSSGPILITGGNGVVAYRIAVRLLAAGYPSVRVGTPAVDSLSELKEAGIEVVTFDWSQSDTFKPALEGVKSVFISLPHLENGHDQFSTFMHAARAAGVNHFVKLSIYHSLASESGDNLMTNFCTATRVDDPFKKVPLVLMHRECDSSLMKTPHIDYAILFPTHFMSNPTVYQSESIAKSQVFYGASGGKKVNYVSPNDVSDVAVRALLAPKDHSRVGYTLTGPAPISDDEVAELLSTHLKAKVTYKDMPLEGYAEEIKDTDWGPSLDVAYLEFAKASGVEEDPKFVTKDIEKVCGHPAETFEDYLLAQDVMTPQELAYLRP